jgi:ABC-2 type transport system ATP-binding protein
MNAIEIEGLFKKYKNTPALNGLTLSVPEGHVYGFLGPNGAGKTTTIKILMGLLRKDSGNTKVFGKEVVFADTSKNAEIGFVPEEFSLYGYMSGYNIIHINGKIQGKETVKSIDKMQSIFNLPLDRKISTYSMGMKKLLSLYVALSVGPKLLILDEPTDGLDPVTRRKLLSFIVEEVATRNMTVFFSSHVLSEVESIADTIGMIKNGKMVIQSDMDTMKENAALITFKSDKKLEKIPCNCKTAGENIYQCKIFEDKYGFINKLKSEGNTILSVEGIPFEEIFMHYMEEKDESAV